MQRVIHIRVDTLNLLTRRIALVAAALVRHTVHTVAQVCVCVCLSLSLPLLSLSL
jgi:hypothetical protein